MQIWLDDNDSITIVTRDGETIADIKASGEVYVQSIEAKDS